MQKDIHKDKLQNSKKSVRNKGVYQRRDWACIVSIPPEGGVC